MVREAIGSALPVSRKKTERPRWKFAGAVAFVDGILELDRKAPRKQRHTAHRIWERMRAEVPGCAVCERTVRQYVQERKTARLAHAPSDDALQILGRCEGRGLVVHHRVQYVQRLGCYDR
jgi:hypothetical protein